MCIVVIYSQLLIIETLTMTISIWTLSLPVQVVAGARYRLTVQVGLSDCPNDGVTATPKECSVQTNTVRVTASYGIC